MMMSANGEASAELGQALLEPAVVAAGWMQSPPWAMLAVVLLTMALVAFAHRERPEQAGQSPT